MNVIPEQRRWSVFGTLRQDVHDGLELFADTLFTDRKVTREETPGSPLIATVTTMNPFYINPTGGTDPVTVVAGSAAFFGIPSNTDEVKSGNANLGLTWRPSPAWTLTGHLANTFEDEDLTQGGLVDAAALAAALEDPDADTAFDPFGTAANNNPTTLAGIARVGLFTTRVNLTMAAGSADGTLFQLPGGDARFAAGVEDRYQNFDTFEATVDRFGQEDVGSAPIRESLRRKVKSEFAEVRVPLIGMDNARPFIRQLELSVGGRNEDYSDVGHAAVPKFGALWSPAPGISFRATWSRAFRPPALTDILRTNSYSEVIPLPDATAPQGSTMALVAFGTNPNLAQERARTSTVGMAWVPASIPKLSVGFTYFDTYYA